MRQVKKTFNPSVIVVAIAVGLALVAVLMQPNNASAEEAPPTSVVTNTAPRQTTTTTMSTTTTTLDKLGQPVYAPVDRTEEAKVVAWGQVAHSTDGSATLVAKQAVRGPTTKHGKTWQVTFDLCAVNKELRLPDTGMVDILMLMGNEVPPGQIPPYKPGVFYHNPQEPDGDILIDNTNTVVHEDGEFEAHLNRFLPAGLCVNVTLVSHDYDMETAFIGFASYDTSSGTHLEGEYTRITPGGATTTLVHTP